MMTNLEIRAGEYVRTKKHGIFKVAEIHKTEYGYYVLSTDTFEAFTIGKGFSYEIKNDIVNHSFNIIDLIEVGDYVNGNYIQEIKEKKGNEMICLLDSDYEFYSLIRSEDIETIVTHEQFKSMEYEVGKDD